jgi:hypothetical protein
MHKTLLLILATGSCLVLIAGLACADAYESCTPCHNGRTAPDLRGRYMSRQELIKAAKRVTNPLMSGIRQNDQLLRDAARDLGLK